MVTNTFSWYTPAPTTLAPRSAISLLMSGSPKAVLRRGSIPLAPRKGIWRASWRTPPATTPTASAWTGVSKNGESRSAEAIMEMLNSTGAKAGAAKWRSVLSTPMATPMSPMKTM